MRLSYRAQISIQTEWKLEGAPATINDPETARRYAKAPDYPEAARRAIQEMHRQVGPLVMDEHGVALRGVLLRHLVMPDGAAGTPDIMQWIARELSPETYVNLMAQYRPAAHVTAKRYPEIDRCITANEFQQALDAFRAAGLHRLDRDCAAIPAEVALVFRLP